MATHLDLEEQEQLEQIKHFWNKWGTPITAVAVVVMAGFAGWNGWQYWQQRQALQASAVADVVVAAVAGGDQARALQAFDTVKADYKGTLQADHAALVLAQSEVDANKLAEAKSALQWVVDNSKDEGYQATAKLRLAAVLMQEKDLDAAAALLRTSFPAEFKGLAADRLGDVLQLQGKPQEATAAYQEAWKLLAPQVDYRALVGFKLNALGQATSDSVISTETK